MSEPTPDSPRLSVTPTENASIEFANQTTNGSVITIRSVTLPRRGYVVIHGSGYTTAGVVTESAITASPALDAGTYRNLTIEVARGVPGGVQNRTTVPDGEPLTAIVYQETTDDRRFDYVRSGGQVDHPFGTNGSVVAAAAHVTVPGVAERAENTAAVAVTNQSLEYESITVARATLPHGGFLVVHDSSYLPPTNDPLGSAVGLSPYLDPGTHRDVTVPLRAGALTDGQRFVVVAAMDTNGNQTYDYVRSDGYHDAGYVVEGQIVTDTAVAGASSKGGAVADEQSGERGPEAAPDTGPGWLAVIERHLDGPLPLLLGGGLVVLLSIGLARRRRRRRE